MRFLRDIVPIMLGKLPAPVRRNLARDNDQIKWTVGDLQTAIRKESECWSVDCMLLPLHLAHQQAELMLQHPSMLLSKEDVHQLMLSGRSYNVLIAKVTTPLTPAQRSLITRNGWK